MTTRGFDPLIVLLLLVPVTYVSVFVHELGHALLGRMAGFALNSFGMGTGRPFLTLAVGGARIYFCHSHPLQGITFCSIPHLVPPRWKMVPYLAGGILANGLLAVVAFALWKSLPRGELLWASVALVNAPLAIMSLVPFQQRVGTATIQSDGLLILQVLQMRPLTPSAPSVIEILRALRGLWESIGDERTLRAYLAASAGSWAELGDSARAAAGFSEAQSLPRIEATYDLACESLVLAAIESGAGRLDAASIALDQAQEGFQSSGEEVGLLYVALGRAHLLILRGDTLGANALLDGLAQDQLLKGNRTLRIDLVVARLFASLASSDLGSVDENLARYDAIRRDQPSSTRDLRVYPSVAHFHAQRGDWPKAEPAFRAAVAAIDEIAAAWADPADRSRFLELQAEVLAEARDCLRVLNKGEDAERLIEPLRSTANLERKLVGAAVQRDRRLFRIALRMMLVNLVCVVVSISLIAVVGPSTSLPAFLFVFGFVCSTTVAALYLLFHVTIGRLIPALQHGGGAINLILACVPWLSLLFIPVLILIDRMR